MKTIGLNNAVESFEMHDSLGNTCAAALFKIGVREFEVYFWDHNSSVARRLTGGIKGCKHAMNAFFERKLTEGFIQPLEGQQGRYIHA
jgi:hypothetical protein